MPAMRLMCSDCSMQWYGLLRAIVILESAAMTNACSGVLFWYVHANFGRITVVRAQIAAESAVA